MATAVVAWTDFYESKYPTVSFTEERHKALVERVKKRHYNFSYPMFMNPYMTPVYQDGVKCELNKKQWDSVLADAYNEEPLGERLSPPDILTFKADGAIWEKEKFYHNMMGE